MKQLKKNLKNYNFILQRNNNTAKTIYYDGMLKKYITNMKILDYYKWNTR